jgi:hypothetical protein
MDHIYEGAAICITAAAGHDAMYGLPGVSQPRSWESVDSQIYDVQLQSGINDVEDCITKSKWSHRAWTFQESWLSKRLLFFTDFGLFYCERDHDQSSRHTYVVDHAYYYSDKAYDLVNVSKDGGIMLAKYTSKELSFDEDILRACSGVLDRMFKGGTVHGLPRETFDDSMLWESNDYESGNRVSTPGALFPSWSWTSAFGIITVDLDIFSFSVAFWASITLDSDMTLQYMIPTSDKEISNIDGVILAGLAWSQGCVAKQHSTDLEFNCQAEEYEQRLSSK